MITISAYNHYLEEKSPTFQLLSQDFMEHGIFLKERPCLCSEGETLEGQVAMIHGARKITDRCYDVLREKIIANPTKHLFVFGISLGLSEDVRGWLFERLGDYPNYHIVVGSTVREEFKRMIELAKNNPYELKN